MLTMPTLPCLLRKCRDINSIRNSEFTVADISYCDYNQRCIQYKLDIRGEVILPGPKSADIVRTWRQKIFLDGLFLWYWSFSYFLDRFQMRMSQNKNTFRLANATNICGIVFDSHLMYIAQHNRTCMAIHFTLRNVSHQFHALYDNVFQ